MPNIYDFIDKPFHAVKKGYRPSYMSCVSAMSYRWGSMTMGLIALIKDIPDTTVRYLPLIVLRILIHIIAVATFPAGIWLWGWVQYMNVQHAVRAQNQLEEAS